MGGLEFDRCMRMLIRHQWVREHGTPRVTTLAGRPKTVAEMWLEWLRLTGRKQKRNLFEPPAAASAAWIAKTAAKASALAERSPRDPVAIVVDAEVLAEWLGSRDDRLSAFIGEGVVQVPATRRGGPPARVRRSGAATVLQSKARSLAELTLFEALEATPATAGRFRLNEHVSFNFGNRAAEVDLLSRADDLAIEVDGFHHFGDVESYRRDRRKDLMLQAHGHVVLRFLADDVLADPRAAVQMVLELLGVRAAREKAHGRP